jgi:endonuclease YncB( thermonuclease family)
MGNRLRTVDAVVTRVIGPDMFEADVDLGFDVRAMRRLKLAGVNSAHLRKLNKDGTERAAQFLRSRIEGQSVVLKLIRSGDHFYAHVCYGPEERDVLEEMVTHGLLERFVVNRWNDKGGNGDEH